MIQPGPVSSAAAELGFTLHHWCFWQSRPESAAGASWPNGQAVATDNGNADVSFLPMMQRRRLSPLARAACAVAWHCRRVCGDLPAVFFSCHGEDQYYLEILSGLAADGSVSPSRFSLCVHNAIGGLHSLHSESFQPYVSLAGGSDGYFTPFLEAAGLLLETPRVMLVWYEQPLPAIYRDYSPSPDRTWALAMVLSQAGQPGPQLRLLRQACANDADNKSAESELLRAVLNNRRAGSCRLERAHWHWNLTDG